MNEGITRNDWNLTRCARKGDENWILTKVLIVEFTYIESCDLFILNISLYLFSLDILLSWFKVAQVEIDNEVDEHYRKHETAIQ